MESNKRMNICKKCPLYTKSTIGGSVCSSYLYMNPKTEEVSLKPKEGYIKGCGCNLENKTQSPNAACPFGKW
jgi:hypothetical protein